MNTEQADRIVNWIVTHTRPWHWFAGSALVGCALAFLAFG